MSFLSIMSGHDANPIFFLKDSTSRTLANPPPPSSDRFCLTLLKFGRLRCISFYLSELNEVINTFCRKVPAND